MSLAAAAIEIGSVAVKHVLKLWFKDRSFASDVSSSLVDILKTKTDDVFAQRKGTLQFEEIGTQIGESLYPLFEKEGHLDEGERMHVAEAVRDAFSHARLTNELMVGKNLDPLSLAQDVLDVTPNATLDMSEVATTLYDRIIHETCTYIVNISAQLPAFTGRTFAEILKRENQLINIARETLEMLRKMQEHLDPSIEAEDFERKYREAVARNLDILQLIGADVSLPNRRHRLSVAYITLSVEQKQAFQSFSSSPLLPPSSSSLERVPLVQDKQADTWETLPVHAALARSHRLLIRGQAGSGKTTLLQWVAVRAATKSFTDELANWNRALPFYIRLRAYAQREFPRPEMFPELVAPMIIERMPKGWVHAALEDGRALVLVDGVDEIADAQREVAHTWLNDLVSTYPHARFIVTSRPHAIQDGWMNHHPFDDAELQPMDLADIETFIDHWHNAVRVELQTEEERYELKPLAEHLKKQIKQQQPLRRLSTNPLLCALLCALNRDRRRSLPVNRIELYRACCELMLERREKESGVDLRDYPAFSLRQKERLLQNLAGWMLEKNLSEADTAQVDIYFERQLANMGGIALETTGTSARRLFVERTSIIREPLEGFVEFTHRTFGEFYAAQAALQKSGVEQLVAKAHLDQWREVIILAAGLASQSVSEQFIVGLLERGDGEPHYRHALHLLAVSCLEMVIQLRPEIRTEVENRLKRLVPPRNMTEAKAVAAAGELAVKHLARREKSSATISAACIRTLALIGSDTSLDILGTYVDDRREGVRKELLKSWDAFDRKFFAKHIVSKIHELELARVSTIEGIQFATNLTVLSLSECEYLTDLSPLEDLTNLMSLDLTGCLRLTAFSLSGLTNLTSLDLSWSVKLVEFNSLAGLTNLTLLNLSNCFNFTDLSPLANLANLATLDLSSCNNLFDLSPLTNLANLTMLDLSWCTQLTHITLTNLASLRSLNLTGCSLIRNLTFRKLTSLTSLDLSNRQQLATLTLSGLASLTNLDLTKCIQLTDISSLAGLSKLTNLSLAGCDQLIDVSPLANLSNLRNLDLSWCDQLTTLTLRGLNNLASVKLTGCPQLVTLVLAELNALTSLNLSWCINFTDLNLLSGLINLRTLDLSRCINLINLSFLAKITTLITLTLSNCDQITDLSSLIGQTNLTSLDLSRCRQLTDVSPLAHLTNLTSLNLSSCQRLTDVSPLDHLVNLKIQR